MKKHEANHLLGRLYMNDIINDSQLIRLTAALEDPRRKAQALRSIKHQAKKLPNV